ncbi:hypothetical protein BDQ17DRAFT_1412416 [Cyathus striatus]|nr:hypothetical protein BDQ17DRAFT_1412416 [Cyathus striatus]
MVSILEISQVLQYRKGVGYSYVICLASLAYDIILNFPDEIDCIWIGMDWYSIPKHLYLLSRYQGFIFLLIRINAAGPNLYATDKRNSTNDGSGQCDIYVALIVFLFALWIIQTSTGFGLMTYILLKAIPYLIAVPLAGCAIQLPPSISSQHRVMAIFWGPCLSISLILFLMTLATLWRLSNVNENLRHPCRWKQGKPYPLLSLILTDGTVFFFLIFIADLIMTIQDCSDTPLTTSSEQLLPWVIAIRSVAGSRLILNLRRMTYKSTTVVGDRLLHYGDESAIHSLHYLMAD